MTAHLRRAYEWVDAAAGTVRVDVSAIEEQRRRLEDLAESMEEATAAFRTLGLGGPADLIARWLTDLEETSAWLMERLRESDLATELAGVASARGISIAEAFAQLTEGRDLEAEDLAGAGAG